MTTPHPHTPQSAPEGTAKEAHWHRCQRPFCNGYEPYQCTSEAYCGEEHLCRRCLEGSDY
jgi:hypothetical protein